MLAPGLWISPHPDRESEAVEVLHDAGIAGEAHSFVASSAGIGDVRKMVQQAWNLDAIESAYEEFVEQFSRSRRGGVLAKQVELVHAWRHFPSIDPALPRELLPPRWSGIEARKLFSIRHANWQERALAEWLELNSDVG